jgi:hypothetical protein
MIDDDVFLWVTAQFDKLDERIDRLVSANDERLVRQLLNVPGLEDKVREATQGILDTRDGRWIHAAAESLREAGWAE